MSMMYWRWGKLYRGTRHETLFERALARVGIPYRTQFPGFLYGFHYFPDFYLPTLQLCIEVDDPSHGAKAEEDAIRTARLGQFGIRTVRVTNAEVQADAWGAVLKALTLANLTLDEAVGLGTSGAFHLPVPAAKAARARKLKGSKRRVTKGKGKIL
jgi:very-short-patch-repair endonuclease